MKKFLFFCCFILILGYFFQDDNNSGPRTLGAYGFAQYNSKEELLIINDELDSIHSPKTYMTTYAKLGWIGEEIDWNKKIYVYTTESYVAVISNLDINRANALIISCFKLAFYDFFHSSIPWFLIGLGLMAWFCYLYGLKLFTIDPNKGKIVSTTVRVVLILILMLNFFHVFDFLALTKNEAPIAVSVWDHDLSLNIDFITGIECELSEIKQIYDWEDSYFASSSELSKLDVDFMRNAYKEASELLFRSFLLIIVLCLVIFMQLKLIYLERRIAKQNNSNSSEEEN